MAKISPDSVQNSPHKLSSSPSINLRNHFIPLGFAWVLHLIYNPYISEQYFIFIVFVCKQLSQGMVTIKRMGGYTENKEGALRI